MPSTVSFGVRGLTELDIDATETVGGVCKPTNDPTPGGKFGRRRRDRHRPGGQLSPGHHGRRAEEGGSQNGYPSSGKRTDGGTPLDVC